MLAIVTFLEQNNIESSKVIYDGMTLKELAENAYSELLAFAKSIKDDNIPEVPLKLKEKLGTLMSTKEMNPAEYISPMFLLGIYMPLVAPMIIPFLLTIQGIIKLKAKQIFGSKGPKNETEKIKTE